MSDIILAQAASRQRQGSSISQPMTRRDGLLKVTGGARFAADNHPPGMLCAALTVASIAQGRVTFLDLAAAKAHPGVVEEVMTPGNRPELALDPDAKFHPFMFRLDLLQNNGVRYANQPIAVVIATTLEAATEGAAVAVAAVRETEAARVGLDSVESFVPPSVGVGNPAEERGMATSRRASPRRLNASRRPMRRRRSITMRWSRTRSSRHGTVTRCRSTRRARGWRWLGIASPGCSAYRRRTSISAAPSSAAVSVRRA